MPQSDLDLGGADFDVPREKAQRLIDKDVPVLRAHYSLFHCVVLGSGPIMLICDKSLEKTASSGAVHCANYQSMYERS